MITAKPHPSERVCDAEFIAVVEDRTRAWRDLTILRVRPEVAQAIMGTATRNVAKEKMRGYRRQLEMEGWRFPNNELGQPDGNAIPPELTGRERADELRRSNWLMRLRAGR